MNGAHLHLLFNHIPSLGSLFGFGLLAWGLLRRSDTVVRVGFVVLVVAALSALAAYLTGEPAATLVRRAPGASRAAIHPHEDAAYVASVASWALGIFSAWLLFRRRDAAHPLRRRDVTIATVAAVLVCALMGWTSLLGGVIRHSEIRSDAIDAAFTAAPR